MISIPVDSIDTFPPKAMNNSWIWKLFFGGCFAVIGALIGVTWDNLSDKLMRIDTTISAITISQNTQGVSLARLEERTKSLERVVYKAKAEAAGLKNPQIVHTALQPNTTFESRTQGQRGDYFITYTILSYDPGSGNMDLRMDAQLPNGTFSNNKIVVHVRAGEIVELTQQISAGPFRIYLQVVDIPAPNQAILAIGNKQDTPGKPS